MAVWFLLEKVGCESEEHRDLTLCKTSNTRLGVIFMEVLRLENISKVYNQKMVSLQALNHVGLSVQKGEFIAVLGRSGSGKTTLLNIIAGIDVPSGGEVFIEGTNIAGLNEKKRTLLRREKIGFIFQAYELLPALTVIENIKLPQLKKEDGYIKELLDILEIGKYEKFYPDQLSGGQKQRAAIARALVNHPAVILADEPTGNLDSKTERIVIDLLKALAKRYKASVILVTHNEKLVKDADRTIRFEDGEIING